MKYKLNRKVFINELALLFSAMVLVNSWNVFDKGFSWSGLGVLIWGTAFVVILRYASNLEGTK